jgi:hypothetical protein
MIWLSNFGNLCNTLNGVLDQWDDMVCCQSLNAWQCAEILLVLEQLIINWLAVFTIYFLALLFYEQANIEEASKRGVWAWLRSWLGTWIGGRIGSWISFLLFVLVASAMYVVPCIRD